MSVFHFPVFAINETVYMSSMEHFFILNTLINTKKYRTNIAPIFSSRTTHWHHILEKSIKLIKVTTGTNNCILNHTNSILSQFISSVLNNNVNFEKSTNLYTKDPIWLTKVNESMSWWLLMLISLFCSHLFMQQK